MPVILPILLTAALLSPGLLATTAAQVQADGGLRLHPELGIKDAYIVVFESVKPDEVDAEVKRLSQAYQVTPQATYRDSIQGFSVSMDEATAKKLAGDAAVAYVEQDQVLESTGEQIDAPWGLASLDQRTGLDFVYRFGTYGDGVHAYIVDSGLRHTHHDFGGRATGDVSFVGAPDPYGTGDCDGHGTAMAGIIGGDRHGVAKLVRLHGVRIGSCVDGGTTSRFLSAVEWLRAHALRPAVVNLSVGTGGSDTVDTAVGSLISSGLTVVAAAGNSNDDACRYSPGRMPEVITVAAVHALRGRVESSSWGQCVDIFAPGEQIPTTAIASDTATTLTGGTSAATAHVTGAVARYLERFPTATPDLVKATLLTEATRDRVTDPHGSPNNLLYLDPLGPGNDGYGRTGADVNGDGRDDIVTFVRGARADVFVALSDGTRFGPGMKWHEYFAAANEIPMLGDFNGDGRDDLVTFTRGAQADVFVALSTGTSFGPSTLWHNWFAAYHETPLVGDFNGDGRDDIATLTRNDTADVYVAVSDGTRFVGTAVKWSDHFAPGSPAVLVGDVNCDGGDDLIAFGRGTLGAVDVALSLGTRFATPTNWAVGLVTGTQVPVVADFNGDGCDDVGVFHRGASGRVDVALSVPTIYGGRTFGPPTVWRTGFAGGVSVPGAGYFNGDHRADIVAFTRGPDADVFVAPSSGSTFGSPRQWNDWFAYGLEIPMPASLW